MKKVWKCCSALMLALVLFLASGCNPNYREKFEYGDFICREWFEGVISILDLSEQGKEKRVIIVPEEINGLPVIIQFLFFCRGILRRQQKRLIGAASGMTFQRPENTCSQYKSGCQAYWKKKTDQLPFLYGPVFRIHLLIMLQRIEEFFAGLITFLLSGFCTSLNHSFQAG